MRAEHLRETVEAWCCFGEKEKGAGAGQAESSAVYTNLAAEDDVSPSGTSPGHCSLRKTFDLMKCETHTHTHTKLHVQYDVM